MGTRDDILEFLCLNKNRWFEPAQIAEKIGKKGKLITSQLDAETAIRANIYCDRLIVNYKRKRLVYGWFDSKEQAIACVPRIKNIVRRSLSPVPESIS